MMDLGFSNPFALWLLPLVLLPLLPSRRRGHVVSSLEPFNTLPCNWPERLQPLQRWLAFFTLLALLLALCGPESRERSRKILRQGIDLMLVLDISASMAATDLAPDRLSVARTAAADFLEQRSDDRVGVILFSGIPYLLSPPTTEAAPVIDRLRSIRTDRLGSGTAVGDALATALGRLKDSGAHGRAVVLLTDGTSNRGRVTPLAAARAGAALGVRVYTIGFGTDKTSLPRHEQKGVRLDPLDEPTLRSIARITGGRYFRAADGGALAAVYRQIDGLEKSPLSVREQLSVTSMRPWLLILGALLATLELLIYRVWLRSVP